jgi:[protein-PII] uridylyltransferase
VTTLGSSVIDVFGLVVPEDYRRDRADAEDARRALEEQMYAVLPTPPRAKPVSEAS